MAKQNKMMKRIHWIGWMLVMTPALWAQSFDRAKLDQYVDALEQNQKFMGSIAVMRNDTLLYTRSAGYSDLEKGIKAHAGSKYRIGSISKTFTTVLVMKAVEKNKLRLSQTIETFFPSIPHASSITIQHLLSHRSGIHNFTDDENFLSWNTQPKSESEMMAIIVKGGSDFLPDAKAAYSNSNFVLLTYILEKIYQQSYADLLQTQIIKPLQLKDTYLGGKIQTQKQECNSYAFLGQWQLQPETDMSIPLGAGAIVSTASDLVRFSQALFNGKLLSAESLALMKTMREGFGLGLFQIPFYDKKGYGHTGGIDGFHSVYSYFSDGNISYALVANGTNYNTNLISIAVLSAIFNKSYQIPSFSQYQPKAEDMEQYVGIYASKQIPLKLTITVKNQTLVAQASGQPAFALEPTQKHQFRYVDAGVVIEFTPEEKTLLLKQGGGVYTFTKE
jgi:CubicO group peptidase (beta-lactamase class C family)